MCAKEYISLECLSAQTNLPQRYLKELALSHRIPSLNVSGRLRFNPVEVQVALDRLAEEKAEGSHDDQ